MILLLVSAGTTTDIWFCLRVVTPSRAKCTLLEQNTGSASEPLLWLVAGKL
jgi:hypothetical protein